MPWDSISYVSSGVTLAAFIVAVGAWVFRVLALRKEKLIRTIPENDRAALVELTLESFRIDAKRLSKSHQFQLALEQLKQRADRFRITALIVTILSLLAFLLAMLAIVLDEKKPEGVNTTGPSSAMTEVRNLFRKLQNSNIMYRSDFAEDDGTRAAEIVEDAQLLAEKARLLPDEPFENLRIFRWYTLCRILTYGAIAQELYSRRGVNISEIIKTRAIERAVMLSNEALRAIPTAERLASADLIEEFRRMRIRELLKYDRVLCLAVLAEAGDEPAATERACDALLEFQSTHPRGYEELGILSEPLVTRLSCP